MTPQDPGYKPPAGFQGVAFSCKRGNPVPYQASLHLIKLPNSAAPYRPSPLSNIPLDHNTAPLPGTTPPLLARRVGAGSFPYQASLPTSATPYRSCPSFLWATPLRSLRQHPTSPLEACRCRCSTVSTFTLQGYLADKKQHPPLGPP